MGYASFRAAVVVTCLLLASVGVGGRGANPVFASTVSSCTFSDNGGIAATVVWNTSVCAGTISPGAGAFGIYVLNGAWVDATDLSLSFSLQSDSVLLLSLATDAAVSDNCVSGLGLGIDSAAAPVYELPVSTAPAPVHFEGTVPLAAGSHTVNIMANISAAPACIGDHQAVFDQSDGFNLSAAAFSDTAGTTGAPAVTFSALRTGAHISYTWTVSHAQRVLGFNAYVGSHRLNHQLIATHPNPRYTFHSRSHRTGKLRLEVVEANGQSMILSVG